MADITVRQHKRKRPSKGDVPPRMFDAEIQARLAAKRAAGKREPVPAPYALPRAYRALAASVRACVGAVGSVLREVR